MAESQMLINYVPGEECRVAIVEDGKLEELYVERFATASRVGNVYVGRVANVEPAIQAAFVDFGIGENGFLHITDLHPRYFPGEDGDTTERVGLKTPRRERPLIQHALRRGDEVIVQVLKEGVGTKGPTLTSYMSIPGRFLVMMPYMDKVGVSRKVEDEEQRREMRQILDQLELPDGFGFILRTAGMDRTKTDLKRDLAYLQRLWKDMERRLRAGGKPRLLYSESDLLVRSLRDLLSNDINRVIIDSDIAMQRAARFMKIVAPRGTTKLYRYPGKSPLFHAFGIEKEIELIHAREVPLPSGGRLVIDQTEALVAIDVNSGKSRESRDAETNAYQTNIEAVDEICRQLRLRDMGGIVINDLIDMRRHEHRKDIENRFKERLKRDRAKSTILSISEFGILEMTRQRMRPSHESTHFSDCPTCRGRGMVQKPDSIASDALRQLGAILDVDRVHKVELAVAPRVAGELLSHKRQLLGRMERHYGKHVDVRVSEALPIDRVSFYAYDDQGADIDTTALSRANADKELVEWVEPKGPEAESDWAGDPDAEAREVRAAEEAADAAEEPEQMDVHPIEIDEADIIEEDLPQAGAQQGDGQGERRGKRRRRGRGGRGREGAAGQPQQGRGGESRGEPRGGQAPQGRPPQERPEEPRGDRGAQPAQGGTGPTGDQEGGEGGRRRRRRRRRGRGGRGGEGAVGAPGGAPGDGQAGGEGAPEFDNSPSADDDRLIGMPPATDATEKSSWDVDVPTPAPQAAAPVVSDESVDRFNDESPSPAPVAETEAPESADEEGEDDSQGPQGAENEAGAGAPADGQEGGQGGRRRRRRRRGRGGRGGGGGGGQQQGQGGSPPAQSAPHGGHANRPHGNRPHGDQRRDDRPRDQGRNQGRGGDRGGDRAPREPRQAPEPRPAPAAQPAPKPAPAKPQVRTLYGAARRKLSASELNKRPKPE
ncbi:MAG: Rne/Rng family ribonuclease [Planctomycetes bacterium]|nr:Rne/Rng family ribonuclease [Planctomycetota bacterium]